MNPLKEIGAYLEQKIDETVTIQDHDKALLSAQTLVTASRSAKSYKDITSRLLTNIPAGTEYAHGLQEIHESISDFIAPREKMPHTLTKKAKSANCNIAISNKVKEQPVGRYDYFLGLMWDQGIDYPSREEVIAFATQWIYDRIDAAIEKDEK